MEIKKWPDAFLKKIVSDSDQEPIKSKLIEHSTVRKFEKGELILEKNSKAKCLYYIESGSVSVEDENCEVAVLRSGKTFGFVAKFRRKLQHMAVIRCNEDAIIHQINYEFIDHLKMNHPSVFQVINTMMMTNMSSIIESSNQNLKKEKLKTTAAMNFFSATVFLTLLVLIFISVTYKAVPSLLDNPYNRIIATNGMLLTYTVVYVIMIYRSHFPLCFYGLTLKNWRRDIAISSLLSAAFLLAILILKKAYIILSNNTSMQLFDFNASKHPVYHSLIAVAFYTVFTAIQEFTTRGVIQGTTMALATTTYEKVRALIIVTMIFCCGHLHFPSNYFALLVMIPSLFWSLLYEINGRRLLGVIYSHAIIGIVFFSFIGWKGILN